MLECGSLKVCAFKSSELLHHNIWEVLARNFPGQFAIINKKIKKKERTKEMQTSFPRLWREKVAYISSQRSSCTRFTHHHVHRKRLKLREKTIIDTYLIWKTGCILSTSSKTKNSLQIVLLRLENLVWMWRGMPVRQSVDASRANNSSHLRSSELMQFQWCFAAWRKFCCLLRFVIARNFVFDLSIKIIT